jgi:Nuclease-related domain
MENIVNEEKIARGARLGKIGTFGGLGFLVAGLIISLVMKNSPLLWLSFVCLLLGILVSSVGTMNMNRWVREPRADQALAQGLKGFDDRYRLYNYLLPAPHVLLSPIGLYVLTALGTEGAIRYEGDKFRRNFSVGRAIRFMADEGVGKPFAEAAAQAQALHKFLEGKGLGEVEIQSVLVFYNPRAQLAVTEPPLPMVDPKGLKRAIRKQQGDKMPAALYRQLEEVFDQAAG